MATAPCKDCADRCVGCHSKCKKYKDYCVKRNKELAKIRKEKMITDGLSNGINIKYRKWGYCLK